MIGVCPPCWEMTMHECVSRYPPPRTYVTRQVTGQVLGPGLQLHCLPADGIDKEVDRRAQLQRALHEDGRAAEQQLLRKVGLGGRACSSSLFRRAGRATCLGGSRTRDGVRW